MTDLPRVLAIAPGASVQGSVEDDAAEDQDCCQWQMMQAQELVAELQRKTFVAGQRVCARQAGSA